MMKTDLRDENGVERPETTLYMGLGEGKLASSGQRTDRTLNSMAILRPLCTGSLQVLNFFPLWSDVIFSVFKLQSSHLWLFCDLSPAPGLLPPASFAAALTSGRVRLVVDWE